MTRVGLGIAGFGVAGHMMAQAVARSSAFKLVAVADPEERRREEARLSGAPAVYSALEPMLSDAAVQAVYLATPTPLHREGVELAASAGLDLIVEKPLAASPGEGRLAVDAADAAGVVLIVGATRSFDAPFRWLREKASGGDFGALRTITNLCASDWLLRPRNAADLAADLGGGIVYRQGGHQLDLLRSVVGGKALSVRATTVGGSGGTEHGYHALVLFDNDAVGTAVYLGNGGFDSRLLTFGRGEFGEQIGLEPHDPRRQYLPDATVAGLPSGSAPPSLGFTLASFSDVDVAPSRDGWLLFGRGGVTDVRINPWPSGWDALLLEFASAREGARSVHDGRSGLATLELCAAVHESSASGSDVVISSSRPNSSVTSDLEPTSERK